MKYFKVSTLIYISNSHSSSDVIPALIPDTMDQFCLSLNLTETKTLNVLFYVWLLSLKNVFEGFPGGTVVENLPANAEDTGSSPGLGRSLMLRSNWAREPQLLSLRVWSLCSTTREAAIVRGPRTAMKSGPRLPQLEKALAQKRRPNTAKNK